MKRATKQEEAMILDYLGQDVANCLYLYADIAKYGIDGENMKVWYDTDAHGIRMVVMKYHTNFQVYTNRDFEAVKDLLSLIEQEKPLGISAREEIVKAIEEQVKNDYHAEYGIIFNYASIPPALCKTYTVQLQECDVAIELADPEDAEGIADLLFLDEAMSSIYTKESLTQQLQERILTGMGRSYIIRDGDRIVAHNATYAESDRFVVIGGLMVHPNYRNTEYANWIQIKSSLEFQKEQKCCYFMVLDRRLIRLQMRLGTPVAAHYGKLARVKEIV